MIRRYVWVPDNAFGNLAILSQKDVKKGLSNISVETSFVSLSSLSMLIRQDYLTTARILKDGRLTTYVSTDLLFR